MTKINTYILTYYKDDNPIVLQTKLNHKQVELIIEERYDLQWDKTYELYNGCDSDIILHECQKLDKKAKYLDTKVLIY